MILLSIFGVIDGTIWVSSCLWGHILLVLSFLRALLVLDVFRNGVSTKIVLFAKKIKKIVLIKEIVNFNLQDHTNYIFFFNSTFIFYQNVSANEVGSVGYELLRKYNLVDGYKDIWYVVRVYMCSDMRFVVSPNLKCMVLVKLVDKKYICHHSQYFTCCIYDNGKCNKKYEVIEIRI